MKTLTILFSLYLLLLAISANSMSTVTEKDKSKMNIIKKVIVKDEIPITMNVFAYGYNPEIISAKKGQKVKIIATSDDVPHSIWIKEYNIDARVEKGKETVIEFLAYKVGAFDIYCRVYCGKGHRQMKGKLVVEE